MRVTFYTSFPNNNPVVIDATWEELVEHLSDIAETECIAPAAMPDRPEPVPGLCIGHDCPFKHGAAWSPTDYDADTTRASDNVLAITCAVFDLDDIPLARLIKAAESIEGYEYLVHSTHSHRPDEDCYRLRLVMPVSRPILPSEWRTVLKAAIDKFQLPADPVCKDLARLYFLPTIQKGRKTMVERGHGRVLDVDELLQGRPTSTPATPVHTEAQPIALGDLRKRLAEVRRKKASSTKDGDKERYAVLGRILEGKALAEPGARDNAVNQAAALLAFTFGTEVPSEAMVEIIRPSLAAMQCEPEGIGHWIERAVYSYTRAQARRVERDQKRDEMNSALAERMKGLAKPTVLDVVRGPSITLHAQATESPDWTKSLIYRADLTLKSCGHNVTTILSNTDTGFRFNLVAKTIEVNGGIFAGEDEACLDTAVTDWLQREWGLSVSKSEVGDRIAHVAHKNAYDPLADYLNGLQWDGTSRVDRFLTDYFVGRCTDISGRDISQYVRTVGRKWLISAVARALDPGCQVDTVLVIEGNQGIRKTSAFRVLGGKWFVDTQLSLGGDKDTQMLTSSNWIIELAELASFKRSETTAQKAFLSRRFDKFRPPYGRVMITCPRRGVFVGTTNDDDYLTDRTGNRRYLPVYCESINLSALEDDRDQLWAEAVKLYKAGETWWLSDEEQKHADTQTNDRLADSAIEAKVLEWWFGMRPEKRPDHVTTHEVAELGLKYPLDRITRGVQTEIGHALKAMKFRKTRKREQGEESAKWIYIAPQAMKEAPQTGRPVALRVISTAQAK